jgi:phage tail-like protein
VRKSPGQITYEPIPLERGVSYDEAFEQWVIKVWDLGSGPGSEVSLKDLRKNITIKLLNEAGQVTTSYSVFRCWVSQYQALTELDASANAVAIQTLTLQHEGWERDESLTEPDEPTV